jgi:hypothetical protein
MTQLRARVNAARPIATATPLVDVNRKALKLDNLPLNVAARMIRNLIKENSTLRTERDAARDKTIRVTTELARRKRAAQHQD